MRYFIFPPNKRQKSGLLVEAKAKKIGGLIAMKFVTTNENNT
jgi:hypothetical protein